MLIAHCDGIGTARLTDDDGRSILQHVVKPLAAKTGARPVRVKWPASLATVGGPMSWTVAAHHGVLELDKIAADYPDERIILVAYSGGCRVVHDWLDTRPHEHDRVAAVGFMSDPFRPYGRQQHGTPHVGGWGVCGQRTGPLPDRSLWTTHPDDVISNARPDALLRTFADLSDKIPGGLLADLAGHHHRGDWQLLWQLGVLRTNPLAWFGTLGPRLDQARRDIEGYLGGKHTRGYTEPFATPDGSTHPLAYRLAASLAWLVKHS